MRIAIVVLVMQGRTNESDLVFAVTDSCWGFCLWRRGEDREFENGNWKIEIRADDD